MVAVEVVKKNWRIILGSLVVIFLLGAVKDILSVLKPNAESNDLKDDEIRNDKGATITVTRARDIGNILYTAFAINQLTYDWDGVKRGLNYLQNPADWNLVFNEFGERQYSSTFGNVGDPWFSGNKNLMQIMINELSDKHKGEIKRNYAHLNIF